MDTVPFINVCTEGLSLYPFLILCWPKNFQADLGIISRLECILLLEHPVNIGLAQQRKVLHKTKKYIDIPK